jgi:catechol 2,3-dioxygenase-like lactoylglutathione lyase family enzyme
MRETEGGLRIAAAETGGLQIIQLALNTCDLPGTLRLYCELLGLQNAGANALWGNITSIQWLTPDARSLIWWMAGAQDFFQFEIFAHSRPACRPMPDDWRASDFGWVRFGLWHTDLDRVRVGLDRWDLDFSATDANDSELRRIVFRDPFVGAWIEVIETDTHRSPSFADATLSVTDMVSARAFYASLPGARIETLERLHQPAHESLWGLDASSRDGFTVWFGDACIEIVSYTQPAARNRPPGGSIADQGIMNVALGSRDATLVRAVIADLRAAGQTMTQVFDQEATVGTYIVDAGRELELLAIPAEMDADLGFIAQGPFIGEL